MVWGTGCVVDQSTAWGFSRFGPEEGAGETYQLRVPVGAPSSEVMSEVSCRENVGYGY